MLKRYAAAAVVGGSMLIGGAIGVAVFAPHLAGAQTPTTQTPSTPDPAAANGGGFTSNEDADHEANESPEREAEENSGNGGFRHGDHHRGGSNEDAEHEKNESPEREAQENSGIGGQSPTDNDPATATAPPSAS